MSYDLLRIRIINATRYSINLDAFQVIIITSHLVGKKPGNER